MTKENNQDIHEEKKQKTKQYKKDWWSKKGKQYKRITSSYSKEDYELIQTLAKKLKRKESEIVSIATMRALKEEKIYIEPQENIEAKQSLIRKTLFEISRIGTNINQIARDFNERRLFSNNNNLTREEKERMLEATEKLEETLINLINN
jgi:hypothetical protein